MPKSYFTRQGHSQCRQAQIQDKKISKQRINGQRKVPLLKVQNDPTRKEEPKLKTSPPHKLKDLLKVVMFPADNEETSPGQNLIHMHGTKISSTKVVDCSTSKEHPKVHMMLPTTDESRLPSMMTRYLTSENNPELDQISPQKYLNALLISRGHKVEKISYTECKGLCNCPSSLQKASYGVSVLSAAQRSDSSLLLDLLYETGLSPNPCNAHGDSLLNIICKHADVSCFCVLTKCGTTVKVVDGSGRTPLHYNCWAARPSFDLTEKILDQYSGLVRIRDKFGKTPLEYITNSSSWVKWTEFFDRVVDKYWPEKDDLQCQNVQRALGNIIWDTKERPKEVKGAKLDFKNRCCAACISQKMPQSRKCTSVSDPPNAASTDLAILVASGQVSPVKARNMSSKARINFVNEP